MPLPQAFVWTRFGTEAGQRIDEIIARKEVERLSNGGVFLWGVGNSVGRSVLALLQHESSPVVAFSPIKSLPRRVDVEPGKVSAWCRATTIDGHYFELPASSVVTSRFVPGKNKHFALVCRSDEPLEIVENRETLSMNCLVNLKTGSKVGFSQVTAVVQKRRKIVDEDRRYSVSMCHRLVYPYVATLHDPIVLDPHVVDSINGEFLSQQRRGATPAKAMQMALELN